ncbi:MAG: STAS domain-containing protein [Alphaproteobacteria bacterium]
MGDFVLNESPEGVNLKLPAVLDFAAAEAFLQVAREIGDRPCAIDASEVARFSTPCAQILVALLRAGAGRKIVNASKAMSDAVGDLGLTDELALGAN